MCRASAVLMSAFNEQLNNSIPAIICFVRNHRIGSTFTCVKPPFISFTQFEIEALQTFERRQNTLLATFSSNDYDMETINFIPFLCRIFSGDKFFFFNSPTKQEFFDPGTCNH